MSSKAIAGHGGVRAARGGVLTSDRSETSFGTSIVAAPLRRATFLYPVPPATVRPLVVAGLFLGILGDASLRVPPPVGVNLPVWVAAVVVAVVALHRRARLPLERERLCWLIIGTAFAAGFAWRDAPALKLLALGCATLSFAVAAYRPSACWIRRAGVVQYAEALALGALHAWAASALALFEATRSGEIVRRDAPWRHPTAAVLRGLMIAMPLLAVFGALFMSADAVFAALVADVLRFDVEWIAGHLLLFALCSWTATGYLRAFLSGTEAAPLRGLWPDDPQQGAVPKPLALGISEVATALIALDLLFLLFVSVQFRYLFGGDALVQVTPNLTYAEGARRGFFELVLAACLVVPVLLAADWLVDVRTRVHRALFRALALVQVGLVLAVAASAFQRLRLYHASYGLTEPRFYATVMLIWIAVMLVWLALTVLRGHRRWFASGALASAFVTVALLFFLNPDSIIARTNIARMPAADAAVRFDVAYASSLSADAVPVLIEALPSLPGEVQCPLARHVLRRWPPERDRPIRSWNASAARASTAVRAHEAWLRSLIGPEQKCTAPPA